MLWTLNIKKIRNYYKYKEFENYIFIWIPKTAGTSLMSTINEQIPVQEYLKVEDIAKEFSNTGFSTFGHISLSDLLQKKLIKRSYYNDAKTFCISRNPYDRFVSLFHYSKKVHRVPQDMSMAEFVERIKSGVPPIGLYNVKQLSQCNPQVDWLKNIRIDKIFKFEDIIDDIGQILDFLNLDKDDLTHLNKSSKRIAIRSELDNETVDFIRKFYDVDFSYFKYDKRAISE